MDPHLALVKEFLKTVPVGEYQEARVKDGMMEDQMPWEAFCQNSGETVSFQDWHSIHHAYRRMGKRVKPEIIKVERRVECDVSALPREWMQKISTVLAKSNSSEIVASYSQVKISRGDVATILPTDNVATKSPKGWLNDKVVETFINIVAASKNQDAGKKIFLVVNSFAVNKLHSTNAKTSANKAGVDASTVTGIEMIPFPMHEDKHWTLVVALPKERALRLYDSSTTHNTKHMIAVRDWITAGIGEAAEDWVMLEKACIQQTNDADVGVFVCINALLLASGNESSGKCSMENGQYLREFVAAVVCKESYPYSI